MAEYSEIIPDAPGYYVYRFWASDVCLYVGRVGNSGPKRMKPRLYNHKLGKFWWPEVTRIEVASFSNHEEIVAEEQSQIWDLRPRHNKAYNGINCDHDRSAPGALDDQRRCVKCRTERYRERNRRRQADPEARARRNERKAEYRRDPDVRRQEAEYRREYEQRPYVKIKRARSKRRRRYRPSPGQGGLF